MKDSVTMSKNALRTCYELATKFLYREFVAEILAVLVVVEYPH